MLLLAADCITTKTGGWCTGHASTLPRMSGLSRHSSALSTFPVSDDLEGDCILAELSGADRPPPVPTRTKNLAENHLKEQQVCSDVDMRPAGSDQLTQTFLHQASTKMAAPSQPLGKPQPLSSLAVAGWSPYSTGTFPGKARVSGAQRRPPGLLPCGSSTLPLPSKQDKPPAAAVRPYTPDPAEPLPPLQRPPTVATSSIYSMYTQQGPLGKSGQGTLPRQPRGAPTPGAGSSYWSLSSDTILWYFSLKLSHVPSQCTENQSSQQAGASLLATALTGTGRLVFLMGWRQTPQRRGKITPALAPSAPPSSSPSCPTLTGAPATWSWRLCAAASITPPGL